MGHGGLAVVLGLWSKLGVAKAIDGAVHVLKVHQPYHESDHVLNIAMNVLCLTFPGFALGAYAISWCQGVAGARRW